VRIPGEWVSLEGQKCSVVGINACGARRRRYNGGRGDMMRLKMGKKRI
jgi:hypothetical protein